MWKWLKVILGTLQSSVRDQRELALENLALRQQLATLTFRGSRPKLMDSDRLFWVALSRFWCPSRLFVRLDFVAIFPSGRIAWGHV